MATGKSHESNRKELIRRSLNIKTFLILMVLVFGMGATVLVAGFLMYSFSIAHEYYISTWNQANAEAAVLEQQDYQEKCDQVMEIYDSIPDVERGDGMSREYQSNFDVVIDDNFRQLQVAQRDLKDRNGPMNSFIVAIDRVNCRMIYICDSDPKEKTFCWPGTWELYPQDQIEVLIDGREITKLDERQGIKQKVQSVITNQPKFGIRCTSGSTLYTNDKYTIMVCVDEKLDPVVENARSFLFNYVLFLLIVALIASFIGMFMMRKRIVTPINKMAKAARAYSDKDKYTGNERTFSGLQIHTGDEIENLAVTLENMEEDLFGYVKNLQRITAQEERINTELNLANRIQVSMLPTDFPAFPERNEFDIYALMNPAREVGGDFYDFFLIDDDHLAIEIADVSGKGIPASLFMMASKILLKTHSTIGRSPAQVLELVNDKVYANNREEMFVTVWLGILEISTGKLIAANAGHEYPVIIHADGNAELIHDKHGFVIGGLEGMKYSDYEWQIEAGDKIFVYTDGLTEATSSTEEFFTTSRIIDALNEVEAGADPKQVLNHMVDVVDEFVGEHEQTDDLTMLCLEYRGAVDA